MFETEETLLRACSYKGEQHYFHTWFQEGGFQPNHYASGTYQEGQIDIGAVLEDANGQVKKCLALKKSSLRWNHDRRIMARN
jgi:hypothetical protein